jgi:hypothetical protein
MLFSAHAEEIQGRRGKTRRLLILENRGAELRLGYGEVKKM